MDSNNNIITVDAEKFAQLRAGDFITGTVFALPNGQMWRVAQSRKSACFMRMTRLDGTLKAGESRWILAAIFTGTAR